MPAIIKQLKPPHMRRWTDDSKGLKRAATQTSAYAEMDPYPVTGDPLKKANLRICGDGPAFATRPRRTWTKPPHTRRWTPSERRREETASQTSAYAEMDLSALIFARCGRANLRIRGDGPSHPSLTSLVHKKTAFPNRKVASRMPEFKYRRRPIYKVPKDKD